MDHRKASNAVVAVVDFYQAQVVALDAELQQLHAAVDQLAQASGPKVQAVLVSAKQWSVEETGDTRAQLVAAVEAYWGGQP